MYSRCAVLSYMDVTRALYCLCHAVHLDTLLYVQIDSCIVILCMLIIPRGQIHVNWWCRMPCIMLLTTLSDEMQVPIGKRSNVSSYV